MRREFAKLTKRDAYSRAKGHCEACGSKLKAGAVHFDHRIADYLGGDNSLANCQCLCPPCHRFKTARQDVPAISKTRRIIDREHGIRNPSTLKSRPFSRATPQRSASRPIERRT